jgi:hypothetical protein
MLYPWTFTFELICLIFAIVSLEKSPKEGYWHHFIPYMLFIVLLEGMGWSLWVMFRIKNHWLYNIELPVTGIFIAWIFYKELAVWGIKKQWFLLGLSIFGSVFIYESFKTKFIEYNQWSAVVRAVLFIIASGVYFYHFLKKTDHIVLFKHPPFLLIAAIFLYYFTSTGATIFIKELSAIYIAEGVPLRHILFTFLNAFLYGVFAYTFRCQYRQII